MPRVVIASFVVLISFVPGLAQTGEQPLFGPPRPEPAAPEVRPADPAQPGDEALAALVSGLVRWPSSRGQDAARTLSQQGAKAVPVLLGGLDSNDWRVRAASAWALGEMREVTALRQLRGAIHDVANRIAIETFCRAILAIDVVEGCAEVIPLVDSDVPRVAKEAFEALPAVLDPSFETQLIEMAKRPSDLVRHRAVTLLRRLRVAPAPSVFIVHLADRSPKVARLVADHLSESDDAAVMQRLKETAFDGSLRAACYAFLALVMAEDRTNRALIEDTPEFRDRLSLLLRIRGEFENAVGAIALANLSMRSRDPEVRKLADGPLVYVLIRSAAGGVLFSDFQSVRDLCLAKAELLTGAGRGADGDAWKLWWVQNADGFSARRELTGIGADDLARTTLTLAQRGAQVGESRWVIRVGVPQQATSLGSRPLFVPLAEMEKLVSVLDSSGFFTRRGVKHDPSWVGDFVDVLVEVGESRYRRSHYGDLPNDLARVAGEITRVARAESWQVYWVPPADADVAAAFRAERDAIAALAEEPRRAKVADLAIAAWPKLDPRGRRLAVGVWREAGATWRTAHHDDLLALLEGRTLEFEEAGDVLALLGELPGPAVTERVLAFLPLYRDDAAAVAARFLAARPIEDGLGLLRSDDPLVRAAAVGGLAGRAGDPQVLQAILATTSDGDPRVYESLRDGLVRTDIGDVLEPLATFIDGASGIARQRAMELLGAVGRSRAVPTLVQRFDSGTAADRSAAIRGLVASCDPAALTVLLELAGTTNEETIRVEVARGLEDLSTSLPVAAGFRDLLASTTAPDALRSLLPSAARVLETTLEQDLGPLLQVDDRGVRRLAASLLAERGLASAVPTLIDLLLDRAWAVEAREDLEGLTCHVVGEPGAREAHEAYVAWYRDHLGETPLEWFATALDRNGFRSLELAGYRHGDSRDLRSIALLIKVLRKSELWCLRVSAGRHLATMRRETLGTITMRTTPADQERIATRWEQWYREVQRELAGSR